MSGRDTSQLSVSREALVGLGGKVLQAALGFAGVLFLTRTLGSDGLGQYRTVTAAAFVVVQFSEGVGSAIKKRVSEVETAPPAFLTFGLVVHAGVSVLTLAVLLLVRPFAVSYFGTPELAGGVVLVTGTLGLFTVLSGYLSGIGYPARATWFDTVRSVATLAGQVGLILWGLDSFGAVAGLAVGTVVTAGLVWLSIRAPLVVPTADVARRTLSFARHDVPTNLLSNFYKSADPLLIRLFAGASGVGYFTLAAQLVMPASMFASSISNPLSVRSSGVDSVGRDVRPDLVNAVAYTGLLAIPIFFGAVAIGEALLSSGVFGESFDSAPGALLAGLALYQVSNSYRTPIEAALHGIDRPETVFRVNLGVTVAYVPAAVGLGSLYGAVGVVAGTVFAEALRVIAYQLIARHRFGGTVLPRPVFEQIVAGAVMFGIVEYLGSALPIGRPLPLLGTVGVGGVVYFLCLATISRHFRRTLWRTLRQFFE